MREFKEFKWVFYMPSTQRRETVMEGVGASFPLLLEPTCNLRPPSPVPFIEFILCYFFDSTSLG